MGGEGVARETRMEKRHSVRGHCCTALVGESLCRTVLGAVQKCGHYRPNRTPGTKSSVGACVLPTRQSLDCLRGRPLHAPLLFVAVRPASGAVLPTHARARMAALRRIPTPPLIFHSA